MKMYKASVIDKKTKEMKHVESEYKNKIEFIKDLRRNGYKVNTLKVKTKEKFDWILQNTDCNIWDWKRG